MRTEIYIENQRLDLYKDISAEFTYNVDDVKDFAARNTNFSKTIVLPGNATNNKLFGHIFEFGSSNFYNPATNNVGYNFNPAKSAACVVYVDRIQAFKGVIRLLEIVVDNGAIEYECAVFGELGGFVSALGNNKIEDLDFSAYNHEYIADKFKESWDIVTGEGYYYPLIDYGQVSVNKHHYQYQAFRPALYVKEYIIKIIEGAGYTWDSDFITSDLCRRLIIPNNQKFLSTSDTNQLQTLGDYPVSYTTTLATQSYFINWNYPTKYGPFTFSPPYTFGYGVAAGLSATARITINGSVDVPENESGNTFIDYYKNSILQSSTQIATGRNDAINIQLDIPLSLTTNDSIEFKIKFTSVTDTITATFNAYDLLIFTSVAVDTPIAYNELIEINKTIPKGIYQKDFFASIVKMFNLYVTESADIVNHLSIKPYIDYYNYASTIDWSNKIDRSKPFRMKPMSELNGRYFEFKYKSDADFYNENYSKKYSQGYADYVEDTGFEFANEKQTAEIIFASSVLVGYAGDDKVVTAIYKKSNTQHTSSEDTMDSVIRIMQAKKIDSVATWRIEDNNSNLLTCSAYGYAGHLDDPDAPAADINFGAPKEINFSLVTAYPSANLFNGFWSDYMAEISDKNSKLLTCNVRLTNIDIYNLDFSKPIWIDGSLWRLNKVIDYNPMIDDTTKCEFLKVIEKTYA